MGRDIKILFLAAEMVPYAKTGGLADVAGALPKFIKQKGFDIRAAIPRYGFINPDKFDLQKKHSSFILKSGKEETEISVWEREDPVPTYFIDNDKYFNRDGIYMYPDDAERFIIFSRAALEFCKKIGWSPNIIHCNDWHTAMIPSWLQTVYKDDPFFSNTATVYTIHNLAYQGVFGHQVLEVEGIDTQRFEITKGFSRDNQINMMGRGLYFSDLVNTVSPTYAKEILSPEYGEGFSELLEQRQDRLFGILNGIDYEIFNPKTDSYIYHNYDSHHLLGKSINKQMFQQEFHLETNEKIPMIGIISRLTDQKGFDLIWEIIHPLMDNLQFQLVVLGTGDESYYRFFQKIASEHPLRTAVFLTFNASLAQKIYASCDMFLMPSKFEPCGLGQIIALRYGTVPIVRQTGGLADTVQDFDPYTEQGNGFTFKEYHAMALFTTITRAIENFKHQNLWHNLQKRCMAMDLSWRQSAESYVELYQKAMTIKKGHLLNYPPIETEI